MIMFPRKNKKYEATKKVILIDRIRDKIRIDRQYTVYGIDINKIIKNIINRSGD